MKIAPYLLSGQILYKIFSSLLFTSSSFSLFILALLTFILHPSIYLFLKLLLFSLSAAWLAVENYLLGTMAPVRREGFKLVRARERFFFAFRWLIPLSTQLSIMAAIYSARGPGRIWQDLFPSQKGKQQSDQKQHSHSTNWHSPFLESQLSTRRAFSRMPTVSPSKILHEVVPLSKLKSSFYHFKVNRVILWILPAYETGFGALPLFLLEHLS